MMTVDHLGKVISSSMEIIKLEKENERENLEYKVGNMNRSDINRMAYWHNIFSTMSGKTASEKSAS